MENIKSLRMRIFERFLKYSNREAIRYETNIITYTELLEQITYVGTVLECKGFKSIAICTDNKMNVIVLALSCMIVGITFIVIDGNNPSSFLENILTEANVTTVIYEGRVEIRNVNCILFDELLSSSETVQTNENRCFEDDVIFYIATSGSTGKPKVTERFLSAFWNDYMELEINFPYLFGQIAQQYAKLNFSYGLENSLLLLIGGTTLCLGNQSISVKDIEQMYNEIADNKASIIFWATPIIKLLSKHYRLCEKLPECIKYVYTGGEPLVVSADLIVAFHNKDITLINDYGCSEIGKIFTYPFDIKLRDMQSYNMVGIGQPLKGYEAVILDENLNEVDEGYLYLKSKKKFPCSYVNKSIKTSEIQKGDSWLYNMHDIARIENNEIIILGREINSVNIAGYRVELEQVEYAVNQIKEVDMCVAMPFYNQYREANLYCFYSGSIDSQEVRLKLYKLVPSYMIPNAFIKVEQVFLLPNGKVDRKKNIEIYGNVMQVKNTDVSELKGRIYQYLANIVERDLGDLNDIFLKPFSDYGVDSLSVADFISNVEEKEKVLIMGEKIGSQIRCLKDIVDLVNNSKEW